jgi:hypothetical protein
MAVNTQDLANLVRNWVHYDNLTTTFSKQTQNARRVRDDFEERILQQLRASNMENAVIQIHGGRLVVTEEKQTQPITLTRLEESLHAYYKNAGVDETSAIMKHIRNTRVVEVQKRLKKTVTVPPLPPPPALQ